jgi:hypothetical protein
MAADGRFAAVLASSRSVILFGAFAAVFLGCGASDGGAKRAASTSPAPASPSSMKADLKRFVGESFSFPIPEGYAPLSTEWAAPERHLVVFSAGVAVRGFEPTITFQRAGVYGGTAGDAGLCTWTAKSTAGGVGGKVTSAALIDGPAGKVCQMRIVAPEVVALITELISATETWIMTCNHADGDDGSEQVCRMVLAGFQFTK